METVNDRKPDCIFPEIHVDFMDISEEEFSEIGFYDRILSLHPHSYEVVLPKFILPPKLQGLIKFTISDMEVGDFNKLNFYYCRAIYGIFASLGKNEVMDFLFYQMQKFDN